MVLTPPLPDGPRSAGPLLRALPWAALALVLAADVAAGGRQVLGLLVAPPLLAAALLTTRGTVAVGAATTLAALVAGAWIGTLADAPQIARVVAVLGSAVAGWWACRLREQRSAQLVRARELAAVTEKLRAREQQQAAVAALGVDALTGLPLGRLMQRACDVVEDVLDVDLCGVLRLEPGLARLRLVAGTGWSPGAVGTATLPADATSQPGWTLAVDEPVVVPRVEAEHRFGTAPLLADHGVASGVTVTVPGPEQPFGVLGAHSRRRRDFSDDDVAFLQLVAVVLGGAIERAGRENAMAHRVLHDSLTGLPNRTLLLDRLHQMYAARGRGRGEVVALFIDLDDFKPVNDTLGHEAGDELLVALAERLRGLVRPSDTVARLAGDEFVVALQEPAALEVAERLTGRIRAALARPFRLRTGQVTVSASVGMALGSMAEDPEALLANADAAMYQAKQSGVGLSAVYDEGLHGRHLRRLHVKQALRGAAERGELSLAYQPLVEIAGGRVGGVEALLRWRHPELGDVSPAEFIPLAEQTGAVDELGRWALHRACEDVARWQRVHGERTPVVHVNLSRRQLGDPGLLDAVRETLDATGADPALVGLEVTESAVLDDPALARTTLLALKALGLRVAMDDFGTGYSSLAQLTRLPVDSVKIDRALVSGLDGDGGDRAVVDGVLRMAGALGLTVTAEGVERPDQLFTLRQLGCSTAQGFFLARPAPAAAIEALLLAPEAPVTVLLPDTPGDLVDLTTGLASRA